MKCHSLKTVAMTN